MDSDLLSTSGWLSFWEITEYLAEAVVALGCVGEYIAEYTKWRTDEDRHRLGRLSLIFLIIGLGVGLLSLIQTNSLSGKEISSLGEQAEAAAKKARLATERSDAALTKSAQAVSVSGNALSKSGSAESAAGSALTFARGAESHLKDALARAEAAAVLAKGYESQIRDAKRDASEAKALLADARQLAADARQQAGEATIGVKQLKANRALTNAGELSALLRKFENMVYLFSGVFADEESIQLLKQIDDALRQAGWRRIKAPHQFPALLVFGKADDDVHEVITTGIQISVDSPEGLTALQSLPVDGLPQPVRAAVVLNVNLGSNVFPPSEPKLVDVQPGTSKTIRIIIGKKP